VAQKIPLLDLGNVVIRVDFTPFCKWVSENTDIHDYEKILGFHRSSLYYDYEFGNISTEEFINRMGKIFGTQFNPEEFQKYFCAIFPSIVDGMPELLLELEDRGVYCLSNTNLMHFEYILENFPEIRKFKKLFASHQIHKRKPYPGIYREVAKVLEVQPQELVFFDDSISNIEGAKKAGLFAHLFESVEQIRILVNEPELS